MIGSAFCVGEIRCGAGTNAAAGFCARIIGKRRIDDLDSIIV